MRFGTHRRGCIRARSWAAVAAVVGAGVLIGPVSPAYAEPATPPPISPSAEPAAPTSATSTPTPSAPGTVSSATVTPRPSETPTPTGSGSPEPSRTAAPRAGEGVAAAQLSLQVVSTNGPVAGRFFEDLGSFSFGGVAADVPEGTVVEVYARTAAVAWTRLATAPVVQGAYATSAPVKAAGVISFQATTGGAPGSGDELSSNEVSVTVANSAVVLTKPVTKIDSLKDPVISGSVVPARPGVLINIEVVSKSEYKVVATATTGAAGTFTTSLRYGRGNLATYQIRSSYQAVNRDRLETSGSHKIARVALINAVVTDTTDDEVEMTYRAGCPVGKSKLRTITMNFYGRDKRMHRGVLIVRSSLRSKIIRGFDKALKHKYPVAKMNNPNLYGGNDPKQMEANNTSGFNCRKVVGNPYRQSPHSYGTAIDVNTVQNPYRDRNGKWWPKNGKSYIDRTPRRFGMLVKSSSLTKQLRKDGFFWGGLWNPGRDYQHFQD